MDKPMVSISCITYNHEPYIRDCLEGFLMQKTNFPFEVLIHDDASTDHTADIIREYEAKYPDVIKPIYQTENQYSKNIGSISAVFNFPRAQGKYIAFCEGDDYWIDSNKLQMQFDFLEAHEEYSFCFTGFQFLRQVNGTLITSRYGKGLVCDFSSFVNGTIHIQTCTTFFRKEYCVATPKLDIEKYFCGDLNLIYNTLTKSNGFYLDTVTSVYRVLPSSASHIPPSEMGRKLEFDYKINNTLRHYIIKYNGKLENRDFLLVKCYFACCKYMLYNNDFDGVVNQHSPCYFSLFRARETVLCFLLRLMKYKCFFALFRNFFVRSLH